MRSIADEREGRARLPRRRARLPLVRAAAAEVEHELLERGGELGRVGIEARHVPHRLARRGGVDLADAGEDRQDQVGATHGGRDRRDGADGHGRHVRGEQVVAEVLAVQRHEVEVALPEVVLGPAWRSRGGRRAGRSSSSRSSVSSVRSLSEDWANTHPNVAPIFSLRSGRTSPSISWYGGMPGCAPKNCLVHRLPRQAGRPLAEDPDQRGVQVAVAALHAELAELVVGELVVLERTHAHPCVAPAELGVPERRVARERRDRIGEHLADVGPRVDREALRQHRSRSRSTCRSWLSPQTSVRPAHGDVDR